MKKKVINKKNTTEDFNRMRQKQLKTEGGLDSWYCK